MRKHAGFFFLGLMLCGLAAGGPVLAQTTYPDSSLLDFCGQVQELIYNDRYDTADSLCLSTIMLSPDEPMGYLFRATGMMGRMTDAEEDLFGKQFTRVLDSLESITERKLVTATLPDQAWMYFFLGNAQAYRALYESRFGSFISAVKRGLGAMSHYEKGLEADSTLYDLYLGLGSYHYWKSVKAGVLKWLFLFKNEKDEGIAELEVAAKSSRVFRDAARSALIWVWLNEKEYEKAVATADSIGSLYPEGKSFMWPLAQASFENRKYRRALEVYEELRSRLLESPGNYFNVIECDYWICTCYDRLHLNREAAEAARRMDDYRDDIPTKTQQRQRTHLSYLDRLGQL